MCSSATTRRMVSIGHGAPAMMPVRSVDTSDSRSRGCSSMAMNMDGTPCRAVQRMRRDCVQRSLGVEARCRKHHGRAGGYAGEDAEHHAEAVIQRYRNAEPVALAQPHRLRRVARVVDDVEVAQRGALGRAGGAAGELDVDRVVGVERCRQRGEPRRLRRPGETKKSAEARSAGRHRPISDQHHVTQARQPLAAQPAVGEAPGRSRARARAGSRRSRSTSALVPSPAPGTGPCSARTRARIRGRPG